MIPAHETQRAHSRKGLATWLIPPASGWRRKSNGLTSKRLLLPITGLAAVMLLLTGLYAASAVLPGLHPLLVILEICLFLAGLGLLTVLAMHVQQDLLEPLTHLRHWALRMRGGNLSARIPVPAEGEFAQLAQDINNLGESLQTLSQDLESQVQKQTERIAQKSRSLEIMYDVAASLNVARDLDDLLTRFLHTLREVVNARAGTVRLLGEDGLMRLVASIGLSADIVERERALPLNHCLCGHAASEGEILSRDDVRQCHQYIGQPFFDNEDMEVIAVPLQYQGRTLGVYNLFVEAPALIAREDTKALLISIGRHLGMAIEKARLDNQAKRLSLIQERTMLAHELHDSLAQTLASLRFQVKMLDETLQQEAAAPGARSELDRIKNSLDEAYTELRELLAHFRAPVDERGLIAAVEKLVARFRAETGLHIFLQNDWEQAHLPVSYEMQVLRVVQEALANIRKHSEAQHVRVMLKSEGEGNYRILIEDDGVGFEKSPMEGRPGEHIGLSIMQDRARRIGGELRIESEPGEGTRVQFTFRYSGRPEVKLVQAR